LFVIPRQNEITPKNERESENHNKAPKSIKEDKMLNRNILLIIVFSLLVMMLASCAEMFHSTTKDEIAYGELKKMGWTLDYYEQREFVLTKDDKVKIQKLLGRPLKYYTENFRYYSEIRRHHGEIGDIIPLYQQTPYGRLVMLVRIGWYSINKIAVVENVVKKTKPIVNDIFLDQFFGKTVSSSFKLVKTAQDLLAAQDNIKPIAGEPAISQEIADRLHELLAINAVDRF
jgi:flagellar basal body-associated protein FliL